MQEKRSDQTLISGKISGFQLCSDRNSLSLSCTPLNTSLISAVPYSFSCIYRISDIVELVCFKCAVIVYDETH